MTTEDPLPEGVGRVPQWWMEITPINVLKIEDEETKRFKEEKEAEKLAKAAALQDLQQKYGGEDFPDWDPSTHGPRTEEEEEEWVSLGWKRLPDGNWVDDTGKPLEGRQFKGQLPPGYRPGEYGKRGSMRSSFRKLNVDGGYARDDAKGWEQPAWAKMKLRSTGTGAAIREGKYGAERSPKKAGGGPIDS